MKKVGDIKRIIAVLGMHRSGTSAIAYGLKSIGVNLGEDLIDIRREDNPRGFWESAPVQKINEKLFNLLGTEWHGFAPIDPASWKRREFLTLNDEACNLVRKNTTEYKI